MDTYVAWIDDVHVLTVNTENISLLLHTKAQPVYYWQAKEKYFTANVEEIIDQTGQLKLAFLKNCLWEKP